MRGDTIFALSSARGPAAVAIVRLSGRHAAVGVLALTGQPPGAPRTAFLRTLSDPVCGDAIDRGLVLWFPAPASVTGEDVAEFHIHGGRAVIDAVLRAVGGLEGYRPAEPGEFTRRAFENGRLDLTAAEGLADLVAAETAAQRRQALRQMGGALADLYEDWRSRVVAMMALVEASLDFSDQELPDDVAAPVPRQAADLGAEIARYLDDDHRGERLRDGLHLAVVGPPNAGKSTLVNRLARRDAVIVSPEAGTTRDVVEVHLDLGGWPVTLADTAGIRAAQGAVEQEGVRRARARAEEADLRLVVFDGAHWPCFDRASAALLGRDAVAVLNKTDLRDDLGDHVSVDGTEAIPISCVTGDGFDALLARLARSIEARYGDRGPHPALTRARHRHALEACAEALERASRPAADEERAEDLRVAATALGRVTGRIDVEDVLDAVFRDFCIGK